MKFDKLAWGFIEAYDELDREQLNELIEKNVPMEALVFFEDYSKTVRKENGPPGSRDGDRLPEMMLLGYLIHLLQDRIRPDLHPWS